MVQFNLVVEKTVGSVSRQEVLHDFQLQEFPLPGEVVVWEGASPGKTVYFKVTSRRWYQGARGARAEVYAKDITLTVQE